MKSIGLKFALSQQVNKGMDRQVAAAYKKDAATARVRVSRVSVI